MVKPTKIHEQEQALSVYFKDMLGEAKSSNSTPMPVKPKPVATQVVEPIQPTPSIEPIADVAPPIPSIEPKSEAVEPIVEAEQHGDVKLLLCKISGMEIAVPVDNLNNIVRWPDKALTKIPGKAPWALGIYSHMGSHTEVIDISHLLLPDSNTDITQNKHYILLVDDYRWGIACEQIRQIVTLPRSSINWRSDSQKRPWFSGIVNDKMSSILEIDALLDAIQHR